MGPTVLPPVSMLNDIVGILLLVIGFGIIVWTAEGIVTLLLLVSSNTMGLLS